LRALAVPGDFTVDGGYSAMKTVLAGPDIPTAVIGGNDLSTIGALRAIHRAGLNVPRDISIIGFDDIHLAEFTEPPLTTIRLPRDEMARRVVSWLIAEIEDPATSADLGPPLETKLIVRESTDWARSRNVFPLGELNLPGRPAIG
jgi:LacI family transcriptional regulator